MKTVDCFCVRFASVRRALFATVLSFVAVPFAWAVNNGAIVQYTPTSQGVSGSLPYTSSYTLSVQPPSAMTQASFPLTVTIRLTPTIWPIGDAAAAATYISFSQTTLTFSSPTQVVPVTVTMNFPATALKPGVPTGAYNYTINTDGWPSPFIDRGSSISSSLTQPLPPSGNPPTVTITNPGATASVAVATFPSTISYQFQATTDSSSPVVTAVGATVAFGATLTTLTPAPAGLNSANASGSGTFTVNAPGVYTLQVSGTNSVSTSFATSVITVTSAAQPPTVTISLPSNNQVFSIPAGATTMAIGYSFTAVGQGGLTVDSVSASLGSTALTPATVVGTGTPTAVATGTLTLGPGTYTLTASGSSQGLSSTASVTFSVQELPTVVINSPPAGYSTTLVQGNTTSIPLTFTGTSQTPGAAITQLTATCDGVPLAVSSASLNQRVATGLATIAVTTAGTHHIVVSATDLAGTATATRDFTVTLVYQVSGIVFFDLRGDGNFGGSDFGLAGVTVKLLGFCSSVVSTSTTDASGAYSFSGLNPGLYIVYAVAPVGLEPSTLTFRLVNVQQGSASVPAIGFDLDFDQLQQMRASGSSLGFWKTNVSKALAGKTGGTQVSAATLQTYTNNLADFALTPFDGLTMPTALNVMSSNSSAPADLLAKQLLAAEYNYENGAYLNGNANLTFLFVAWGESILQNANSSPSSYVLWAKNWFEAYDTSAGGLVDGPDPLGGSNSGWTCSGADNGDD